ncbi:MAG: alpha-hydroxy-acid oxidizing protein, partial [Pseudolabrys sp.]|nr:alpha-hydroxy-acid oxidizing protein [Pseudolabrys sp.]
MHGMTPKKGKRARKVMADAPQPLNAYAQHADYKLRHQSFPSSAYLRRGAPRNVPRFAYEYGDTGAGADTGIAHNWAAFDNIKIVPRYGAMATVPPVEVDLFGKRYSAPVGIAPMGGPSLVWPAADLAMARAAQKARVPYTLGVAGGATIEQVADVAGDVFWLQLYRFWRNEHAIGMDLCDRATAAGVNVLALTVDVPVRTTRTRESYAGLGGEFKPSPRMIKEMLLRPKWLMALLRNGYPRFATIRQYAGANATTNDTIRFARQEMGGVFTWEEVARYR